MTNEAFSIINLFKLISFCKHANAFTFSVVLQKQAMSKPVMLMNYIHTVVHFSHYSLILLTALHAAVKSTVQVDVLHCVAVAYFHFSVCVLTILVFLSKTPTRMCSCRLPLHSLCLCLYGPLFFSAFQQVTVSGISWLAKPSVQTLDFNLVLFLLAQCSQYLLLTILVS